MKHISIIKNNQIIADEESDNFDICEHSKLHRMVHEQAPCIIRFSEDGLIVKEFSVKLHKSIEQ